MNTQPQIVNQMNWFQEKIFYTATVFASSTAMWLGTFLTEGDVRWLYGTGAASLMTSGFIGLALRKEVDSVRILIARTGIGFLGGVFGTKIILFQFNSLGGLKTAADSEIIILAGVAAMVATVFHIIGFAIVKAADDSAQNIASKLLDRLLVFAGIYRSKSKDDPPNQ